VNLYIWDNFCSDFSSGLAMAVAHNKTEAIKLVNELPTCLLYPADDWGDCDIYPLGDPIAFATRGGA